VQAFASDESPLSTGWTTLTDATGGMKSLGGVAVASAEGPGIFASYWDTCSTAANQYSQGAMSGSNNYVAVRMSPSNDTMYYAGRSSTENNVIELWKYVNGTYVGGAALGSYDANAVWLGGRVLKLTATGTSTTTLKVYYDGTEVISVTDSSTPIESGNVGIMAELGTTGIYIDDWSGGDL
jgi:hypothetical protein